MLSKAHRPVHHHGVLFACSKGRISDPLAQAELSIEVRSSVWCALASSQSAHVSMGQGDCSSAGATAAAVLLAAGVQHTQHSVCKAAERESPGQKHIYSLL